MAGKRYAILIASSKYPDEPGLAPLRCPENDVDALNEILGSPDFGQFTETFVLKNAPSHEVQEKMETVLAAASKDDLVLIYFSGHGKQMDRSYQLCLTTANTRLSALATTSIPAATIKLLFDHSFAKSKILILDCCYSGAIEKAFKGGGVEEELKRMSNAEGTFIMTASTDFQVAVERPEDQLSLFTKHLVAGIRSGEADKNEDGLIDINELHSYVCEKVRQEGTQKPLEWHLRSNGDLILSRSGKDAKEKRRQELRAKLCGLAAQGYLSDRLLGELLKIASMSAQEMTARERECSLLIERLADGRMSLADFVESWLKTSFVPEKPPVLALPVWKIAAVLVVGAAWYFMPVSPVVPSPSEEARSELPAVASPYEKVTPEPPAVAPQKPPAEPAPKQHTIHVKPRQLPDLGKIRIPKPIALLPPVPSSSEKAEPLPEKPSQNASPQRGRTIGQYIDHGDGTITDTKTGLMWKRCAEGLSGVTCEEGKLENYKWDDAVKRFKDVEYAGYSYWRLPTIDELKTLVYCSKGKKKDSHHCNEGSEQPTINQQAFPNTEATQFWSGSPYAGYSIGAWYVNFYNGYSLIYDRDYPYAVRLVRGGQ
ncbi:DUF1566 domain-containing protein [Desulfobulbus sp. F5]|nr:DUF1566 domain-containing protein [Desulfobulbus sp. F5]